MTYWLLFPGAAMLSLLLTGLLRRYAVSKSIMDIPNSRSSHVIPTPRGGGVAIVITFLVALCMLLAQGTVGSRDYLGLAGAGLLIAIIGFMDDHGHIAARWRLLGHFLSGGWALFWMSGFPSIKLLHFDFDLGVAGLCVGAIYLVWLLNLYNFMDGIDGIASVQAICASLGACVVYSIAGYPGLIGPPLLLAGAVAGFLFWNFPPARIFMGDAGSGFLGITFGVLSLQAAWALPEFFWVWLVLLGVFIVDATYTLCRRLLRRERVYEAHRSHAYQYASRECGKHLPVTLAVLLINVVWLIPLAVGMLVFKWDGFVTCLVAYLPLTWMAWKFKAGQLETIDSRPQSPRDPRP
ncbi:glycosyltransferase family 4 protein [Pseudomonas sp. HR96]|uniref:MraY family glycosyltransferase n=1 Tax=Pseudomonas sp. HR96 TaxID=1027966 RepID=UPI002A75D7BB|nr:glycosyltransferase family 4 protein [Pseudomonas sp. HR96]WPO98856.1 glycosyltransferase family 4 protein [Pseudomonas sp. HR96]